MIIFKLDKLLCDLHMTYQELAARTGLSEKNLRAFASGNVEAVKISTLNNLCEALYCSPADLLDYNWPDEIVCSK